MNGKRWTEQEDQIMKDHYPETPMETLLEMLPGRTKQAIYGRAGTLGLERSEAWWQKNRGEWSKELQKAGKKHRFVKGHEPYNKGLSQSDYMSPEAIEKSKATRFKKGRKPHNTKWDGAISICRGHKKRGHPPYLWIRISEGCWKQYQHYLWEKANGPIPAGKILACKDGDTLNPHPGNWELITRAEHARRNCNHEKMAKTMKAIYAGKKKPRKLTKYQAAKKLSGGDPDLRDFLLEHRPDLVKVALLNWKLKREIKYGHHDHH